MTGLNLHGIVRGAVSMVNPDEDIMLYTAAGQENVAGKISSKYFSPIAAKAQIQSGNNEDLKHANNIGYNGVINRFYLYASSPESRPAGIVRPQGRGGDLIQCVRDGSWWLIIAVPDDFSNVGWASVLAALQAVPPNPVLVEPP